MDDQNDNVQRLDFSDEFLLASAEKRYDAEDYLGALTVLNKRAGMYEPSADACALYADIYEALELYSLCADAWYRFLDTCNEADFTEGYEGLAVAYMNLGDEIQAELQYRRAYNIPPHSEEYGDIFASRKNKLRLVHSDDGSVGDPELLQKGLGYIRLGELGKARKAFAAIPPESKDFASASGLIALCMLLEGNKDGAAAECRRLLESRPDDVSVLTTYCAVLGAQGDKEGAKKVGRRLATLKTDSTEDAFRVATALCETELDEEAYEKLSELRIKAPYNDDALWFFAVAAYKTGRKDEAIESLERLTTVYPRKAVANYYLTRLRGEDGAGLLTNYFYRLPDDEYKTISAFLLAANRAKAEDAERFAEIPEIGEYFRLAFDQLDGRDEKLRSLAAKAAVKCRCDFFIREILLDYTLEEPFKIAVLRDLIVRNEDNSFGVVVCGVYREFFTHEMDFGPHKRKQFINAFANVYANHAIFGEDCEEKIVIAAEDVNRVMEEAGATDFFEEQEAIAAVIYREAHLPHGYHSIDAIADLFGANVKVVKEILDFII